MRKYLALSKFTVIIPVSLSAFTGYFLHKPVFNDAIILVTTGVLLLGAAASALNQLQEKKIDRMMERTKLRPFPSKVITIKEASGFILFSIITGSFLIMYYGNILAMILGLFTMIWYNGIYTYLKRVTPFAIIPGSITGALPPIIGWTAGGGDPLAPTSVLLGFIFFMGQIPHFWLLIIKYGNEYEAAGLPSLNRIFSEKQIKRLTFIWTTASLISALLLGFFGIIQSPVIKYILLFITLLVIFLFRNLLTYQKTEKPGLHHFIILNLYFLFLMIILIIDKILAS